MNASPQHRRHQYLTVRSRQKDDQRVDLNYLEHNGFGLTYQAMPSKYHNRSIRNGQDIEYQQKLSASEMASRRPNASGKITSPPSSNKIKMSKWVILSRLLTCCVPGFIMSCFCGKRFKDKLVQQAWREKVSLCIIILLLSAAVAFTTVGLEMFMCGPDGGQAAQARIRTRPGQCPSRLDSVPDSRQNNNFFEWTTLPSKTIFVINGIAINADSYLTSFKEPIKNDALDATIRKAIETAVRGRKDATRLFAIDSNAFRYINCIQAKYKIGVIDKKTTTCFIYNLILVASVIVVTSIILIKFLMSLFYNCFIGKKISIKPPLKNALHVSSEKLAHLVAQNVLSNHNRCEKLPGKLNPKLCQPHIADVVDFYTAILVTCYSESEASLRLTLDSLAQCTYRDDRKLLFVVADGLVKGSGNDRTTADLLLDMLEMDDKHPEFGRKANGDRGPNEVGYTAVGLGSKNVNHAKVYAGWYLAGGHKVPMILVIKCGTPSERGTMKPGNRGKRDSQLILMNFFSRCTFYDRMTPLDYDLFKKIHWLMGVNPDRFELTLMVDADTKVAPNSLSLLINTMHNDPEIVGLCGETRIANRTESWVTMIQVFEYFISHYMGKSFESVFGGVTCLPGCFSMWRLKGRPRLSDWKRMHSANDVWVPLLTSQEVIEQYDQNEVNSLHQKNLLLLGEDRFLTTLMLKHFPRRKIIFVPSAVCHTVVPTSFRVLLSQRRRWINSTIHNLMELVRVPNLCGTFCFSMQFVVFIELLGTSLLPVGVGLLCYLLYGLAHMNFKTSAITDYIPLALFTMSMLLPVVLVMFSTSRPNYVLWLFFYLLAIPIWQLVLPVYAFWHFDDFSWGETRKLSGGQKDQGHDDSGDSEEAEHLEMHLWHEWEAKTRLFDVRNVPKRAQMSPTPRVNRGISMHQSAVHRPRQNENFMNRPDARQPSYGYL